MTSPSRRHRPIITPSSSIPPHQKSNCASFVVHPRGELHRLRFERDASAADSAHRPTRAGCTARRGRCAVHPARVAGVIPIAGRRPSLEALLAAEKVEEAKDGGLRHRVARHAAARPASRAHAPGRTHPLRCAHPLRRARPLRRVGLAVLRRERPLRTRCVVDARPVRRATRRLGARCVRPLAVAGVADRAPVAALRLR